MEVRHRCATTPCGSQSKYDADSGRADPNYGDFGIAIPQLQEFAERTIADHFANPEVIPVVPRDPSFPRNTVPSYLTETASLGPLIMDSGSLTPSEELCLKIFDFGRSMFMKISNMRYIIADRSASTASWINELVLDLPGAAPPTIRPPEVYIHELSDGEAESPWSKEADTWAVGCIVGLSL